MSDSTQTTTLTEPIFAEHTNPSPINLHDLINAHRGKPFEWGVHDCLLFSGDIAQTLSGKTLIESIRGKYSTPRQALKLIKAHGFEALDELFGAYFEPILPLNAQRGDVVLCEHDGLWGKAFAVVTGSSATTTGETDLVKVPMHKWLKAWRITSCLQ